MIAALLRECEAAVREDGAEAVALGCTCMAPVGPLLAERCSVPVIESSRAALRAAISAAQAPASPAAHASGFLPASRARNPRLVPAIVSAWQLGARDPAGHAADASAAECSVCLTEDDLR